MLMIELYLQKTEEVLGCCHGGTDSSTGQHPEHPEFRRENKSWLIPKPLHQLSLIVFFFSLGVPRSPRCWSQNYNPVCKKPASSFNSNRCYAKAFQSKLWCKKKRLLIFILMTTTCKFSNRSGNGCFLFWVPQRMKLSELTWFWDKKQKEAQKVHFLTVSQHKYLSSVAMRSWKTKLLINILNVFSPFSTKCQTGC